MQAIGDYFIWVPNGVGAVLGALQLALIFVFPRSRYKCAASSRNSMCLKSRCSKE